MPRDEVYKKVQAVLVDALGVDEDEVTPRATLREDLGAESIDFLDIVFRLEKAFTTDPAKPFKIPRGELFPENLPAMMADENFVKGDTITPAGVAELKKRMPFSDFTEFDKSPTLTSAQSLLNVDTIVNYMQMKLNG
ncbi:MAG: acyl carrier protein [Planctomycetota bacterium]|nr:acyl carrier protein [Planctomycetota bacterium]